MAEPGDTPFMLPIHDLPDLGIMISLAKVLNVDRLRMLKDDEAQC